MTEERRRELTRVVGQRVEDARIAVRNVRRDIQKDLRDFERDNLISEDEMHIGMKDLQRITDELIQDVNVLGENKHDEIMRV